MKLKDSVLQNIKKNKPLRRALEDLWEKSFYTIDLWLKTNDPMLSNINSLNVISAYLKIDKDDLTIAEDSDFNPVI